MQASRRFPGRDDTGERIAVVEAVGARLESRFEGIESQVRTQATILSSMAGHVERIGNIVECIEKHQAENRAAGAREHAELKADVCRLIDDLAARVDSLESERDQRKGASDVKAHAWRRLDAWGIGLMAAISGLLVAIIEIVKLVIERFAK